MRRIDRDALAEEYGDLAGHPDSWLRCRLRVDCPKVNALEDAVFADLDAERYGVGWWAPHPGAKRRILISDCLLQAIGSIQENLLEARLHLLELEDCCDQVTRHLEDAAVRDRATGDVRIRHPRPSKPLDQLPEVQNTMHVIGMTRALNSALDCMAAAVIGVAAIPIPIQKANYGGVLRQLRDKHSTMAQSQLQVFQAILELETAAGPPGWCTWLREFRNMTVHRGRRLDASYLEPRRPPLFGPDGEVVLRVDSIPVLPSEPGWSDIQALRGNRPLQLAEPATRTLAGALDAMKYLVNEASGALLDLWQRRRREPALLHQPREQWPDVEPKASANFGGFEPGRGPSDMSSITGSDRIIMRMRAAALDADNSHRWGSEFD